LREAAFGNATEARQEAASGLKLAPGSQAVQSEAVLAFAMAGGARAESLAQDLNKRFPLDTQYSPFGSRRFTRNWQLTERTHLML
jgi:hypothetical protein